MNLSLQHQLDRKNQDSPVKSGAGFALVLVLWVLSLLSIMAGSFALSMRRESTVISAIKTNASAVAMAEAGVAYAEMMLLNPEPNKRWRTDGNIYQVDFGTDRIRVRLLSENGKIDINKANLATLQALFADSPATEEQQAKLVGAILDWRDGDDLKTLEGAEKKEYEDAGLKYQPRNEPFQSLDELQMVLGMDEKVHNWLKPLATVYSRQAKVSLKLASYKVLKILPELDTGLLDNYLVTRLESAKNDLPAPEFGARLGQNVGSDVGGAITVESEAFMADESSANVTAVLMKESPAEQAFDEDLGSTSPFKVLEWQRNPAANETSLFSDEMSEFLVKQYAEPELSD